MDTDNIVDLDFKDKIEALIYKYNSQANLIEDLYRIINKQKETSSKNSIEFIEKEFFIKCIQSYHELQRLIDKLHEKGIDCYECDVLITFMNNFIELIRHCSNDGNVYDSHSFSDIEFFIYDIDYGTKWTKESIVDKNDNPIDISTVDKLYNYLKTNFYNKEE